MSEEPNPFAPPEADWEHEPAPAALDYHELAGRGPRLAASILDFTILFAFIVPLQFALGIFNNFPSPADGVRGRAAWSLGSLTLWLAINAYPLAKNGQTFGKRVLGIRIANSNDDRPATLGRIFLLRMLSIQLLALLPVVGSFVSLIDVLLIFRKDRRCLHDHVAGTRVVRVEPTRRPTAKSTMRGFLAGEDLSPE